MNKTAVFITFVVLASLGVIGTVVIVLYAPQHVPTFTGFLINLLGIVTLAAGTFYGLGRLDKKVETVQKQTNGTLSKLLEDKMTDTHTINILTRENAELEAQARHQPKKASTAHE